MNFSGISAPNLADMFKQASELYRDRPAFASRQPDGSYSAKTYSEVFELGACLGAALIELGVQAREHVGLISDSRLEWNVADYAIVLIGAADVPRGTDVTGPEIEHILNHSDAKVVFVENRKTLDRVIKIMPQLDKVQRLVLMEPGVEPHAGALALYALVDRGRQLRAAGDRSVEERMAGIRPEDLFTLIYTSGTTGTPKGVQLTHANIVSQTRNLPFELAPEERMLSILPIWHIYERVFQMVSICNGCCTYFTTIRTIGEDLKTAKPTIMASAPRVWENLYLRILKNVQAAPAVRRALFHAAYYCSRQTRRSLEFLRGQELDTEGRSAMQSLGLGALSALRVAVFYLPCRALDAIVLKKIRAVVGGCLRRTISGGGALQRHVDEFFNYIGIAVLEGYGLTETCPVLAVRTGSKRVIGTVGPIFAETEIRILDLNTGEILYPDPKRKAQGRGLKGEIHARGPQVMRGYYRNEEATRRVLGEDGWFNTGDIGIYTFNDCLRIVGRSKDTIVLLSGENTEPVPIEAKLCESPLIEQCMVVGQDRKQLGALIVPSLEGFKAAGIEAGSIAELAGEKRAAGLIHQEAKRLVCAANGFKAFEHVHALRLLPKPFELGDELTSTFKIKRHVVSERYAELVDSIFEEDARAARSRR